MRCTKRNSSDSDLIYLWFSSPETRREIWVFANFRVISNGILILSIGEVITAPSAEKVAGDVKVAEETFQRRN